MANAVSCFYIQLFTKHMPQAFLLRRYQFQMQWFYTNQLSDSNQFFQAGISPVAIDGRSVLAVVSITVGQVVGRTQPPGIGGIVVKIGKIL